MRTFFVKLAVFIGGNLLLLALVNMGLGRVENSYIRQRALFEPRAGAVEMIVVGSSQSLHGVNPAEFDRPAFNLSNRSQDVYYDAQLVRRYLDRTPHLRLVLLELTYFSLEFDLSSTSSDWRCYLYKRAYGIPCRDWLRDRDPRYYNLVGLYGGVTTLKLALRGFSGSLAEPLTDQGWEPRDEKRPAGRPLNDEDGKVRVQLHHSLMRDETFAAQVDECRWLIADLRRRGIAVAIITPPVHDLYARHIDPAKVERLRKQIRAWQEEYQVAYLDHFRDDRFGDEDFFDVDHLNPRGAARFSALLRHELGGKASPGASHLAERSRPVGR